MPIYDRSYRRKPTARCHRVPRLQIDVMHHQPFRHHHDVKHRRAHTERDLYRHSSSRGEYRTQIREQTLSTRSSTYGYDRDYVDNYYAKQQGEFGAARVQLYTHDSSDPYSCTCYPRVSKNTIPSMMYDEVRCPHPEHMYQPAEQDVFAYPWTTQTFRPNVVLQHGYKRGQITPPSAVSAPPFTLYHPKNLNPSKGSQPPPYSAPEKPLLAPLLAAKPSDRRLRRVNRQRVATLPKLDTVEEDVSPFDSISQGAVPLRSFRPPSLRLGTVDTRIMGRVDSDLRGDTRMRAMSTPRALPALDFDGFPETPNRIFKGEYVDSEGQKYEYDIKYGKKTLDGKRTRLQTI
ncbi:hypothetical protein ACOMHN_020290 [Nucella lapillus]